MPDPQKLTISATQAPALFNLSPYASRWMLWQHFANGIPLGAEEDEFIREGRRLQPFVLERAATELRLLVTPNEADVYVRAGLLGATRDAEIHCPDRGPGALETKCVFNWRVWATEWENGARVPPHCEMQLQQQMLVGAGGASFEWGVVAAWHAGQQFYFERAPVLPLWESLHREADAFMRDVTERREPDPFGLTVEMPWLSELYPTEGGTVLDMTEHEDGEELRRRAAVYLKVKPDARNAEKVAEAMRAGFIARMKERETMLLPGGGYVRLGKGRRLKVWLPDVEGGDDE